jgi:hypothetical protein
MAETIQNLPRWIFSSVSEHFNDRKQGLHLYIEGFHRATRTEKDFIELRVDGPYLTELSKGYWKVYSEINVLVQSAMDDEDYHRVWKDIGIVAVAFSNIPVYKFGDGPDDDNSLLGCMNLINNARDKEKVQVSYFGKIAPSAEVHQATVEGHYEMRLTI